MHFVKKKTHTAMKHIFIPSLLKTLYKQDIYEVWPARSCKSNSSHFQAS